MISNLAYGKVLIIASGYYTQRALLMAGVASKAYAQTTDVRTVDLQGYKDTTGQYDWVVACSTETSIDLKRDVKALRTFADTLNAKLMLNATASIDAEDNHELADAVSYSSCKGLVSLTGAAFVTFNKMPSFEIQSFYRSIASRLGKDTKNTINECLALT